MQVKDAPLLNTYSRADVVFVSGKGCLLKAADGREYLDCLSGIAVASAGHGNAEVAEAIGRQAEQLVHVSNLYWTEPMAELAYKLNEITGGWGRVFYANSGAEANECAIKLARKWAGPGRFKIVCAEGSFHGRTLAALAATGQPGKWAGFEPLPKGFVHAPFNDLDAFSQAVDEETAAVMVEPIQGENGVVPATQEFLEGLRELCEARNLAFILDEVQTGMGRTGSWWAFQNYGVKPDIFTSAKALANGLPLGACLANDKLAEGFSPSNHASTFGGGPVVCSAALATIRFLEREKILESVSSKRDLFRGKLSSLPGIIEVRGAGLLLAAVFAEPQAKEVTQKCFQQGLLVNAVAENAIRLAPPLVITAEEIERAVSIVSEVLN